MVCRPILKAPPRAEARGGAAACAGARLGADPLVQWLARPGRQAEIESRES